MPEELRNEFHKETGIAPVFSNRIPHIDYINWLEAKLTNADQEKKKEAIAFEKQLNDAISLLKEYEQWEADIISENKLWWPNTAQDVFCGKIYDTMLKLQQKRNEFFEQTKQ